MKNLLENELISLLMKSNYTDSTQLAKLLEKQSNGHSVSNEEFELAMKGLERD